MRFDASRVLACFGGGLEHLQQTSQVQLSQQPLQPLWQVSPQPPQPAAYPTQAPSSPHLSPQQQHSAPTSDCSGLGMFSQAAQTAAAALDRQLPLEGDAALIAVIESRAANNQGQHVVTAQAAAGAGKLSAVVAAATRPALEIIAAAVSPESLQQLDTSQHAAEVLEDMVVPLLLWGKQANYQALLCDGSLRNIDALDSEQCKSFLKRRGCRYGNLRQARRLQSRVGGWAQRQRTAPHQCIGSILQEAGVHHAH